MKLRIIRSLTRTLIIALLAGGGLYARAGQNAVKADQAAPPAPLKSTSDTPAACGELSRASSLVVKRAASASQSKMTATQPHAKQERVTWP